LLYYYKALTRFGQIQSMEEKKEWEQLFDNKENYYRDIDEALEKIEKMKTDEMGIVLKAKLLKVRTARKKDEDPYRLLEALVAYAQEFAGTPANDTVLVKEIAGELFREGEANYAKRLYNVYVAHVTQSEIVPAELKAMAEDLLANGNADIAIPLFAAYVDKLIDTHQGKEFIMQEALAIIGRFADTGWQRGADPFFAEEIFAKIETIYTSDAFTGETQYLRAYNLEQIGEFDKAIMEYSKLIHEFPDYRDKDRIYFRIGVINAYMLARTEEAKTLFSKVANEYKESQDYYNSVYHLGLIHQWEKNNEAALQYYSLINDAGGSSEIFRLAQERTAEIKENKDIEYNLRMFLAAVLGKSEEVVSLQLNLFADRAKEYAEKAVVFRVNTYLFNSGCLQQAYTYLWSGQTGLNQTPLNQETLETRYQETGTKVVFVALVDPTGLVSGASEIVDIHNAQ